MTPAAVSRACLRLQRYGRQASKRPLSFKNVCVMGLDFASPLGLAAGFDRMGQVVPALTKAGMGFVELGTFDPAMMTLLKEPLQKAPKIGISIGPGRNCDLHSALENYHLAASRCPSWADYLTVNFSSPFLQELVCDGGLSWMSDVVERVSLATTKPWAIKLHTKDLSPDLVSMLRARNCGAVIAVHPKGKVLGTDIQNLVARLDGLALISVGNLSAASDLYGRIKNGAALAQVFSTVVRRGPEKIRQICQCALRKDQKR